MSSFPRGTQVTEKAQSSKQISTSSQMFPSQSMVLASPPDREELLTFLNGSGFMQHQSRDEVLVTPLCPSPEQMTRMPLTPAVVHLCIGEAPVTL